MGLERKYKTLARPFFAVVISVLLGGCWEQTLLLECSAENVKEKVRTYQFRYEEPLLDKPTGKLRNNFPPLPDVNLLVVEYNRDVIRSIYEEPQFEFDFDSYQTDRIVFLVDRSWGTLTVLHYRKTTEDERKNSSVSEYAGISKKTEFGQCQAIQRKI